MVTGRLLTRNAWAGYRRRMSQTYASSAELEAMFTTLFDQIAVEDPDGMDDLVEQQLVIRFRLRKPDVDLWIDGRSAPVETSFGTKGLDATLTAEMSSDSMHELLLGTLGLAKALLFRTIKVQGSKSKAMKLESLLHTMQAAYTDMVDES